MTFPWAIHWLSVAGSEVAGAPGVALEPLLPRCSRRGVHLALVALLLLALGSGCGDAPPDRGSGVPRTPASDEREASRGDYKRSRVLRQLRALEPVLYPRKDDRLDQRFASLRSVGWSSDRCKQWIMTSGAAERLGKADVVLVGDIHDQDICRRGWGKVAALQSRAVATAGLELGLALEALSPATVQIIESARGQPAGLDLQALLGALRGEWPWPCAAYVNAIQDYALTGVPMIAGWGGEDLGVPNPQLQDALRRPVEAVDSAEFAERVLAADQFASDNIVRWMARRPGCRRVCGLFGLGHVVSVGRSLAVRLREQGLAVLVVLPYVPEWEFELQKRGARDPNAWLEVFDGVLYPPYWLEEQLGR